MKIVIIIGMLVIFISTFFILFIFDRVIMDEMSCMAVNDDGYCDSGQSNSSLVLGITLIAMFLIVDSAVLYIIIKCITASGSSYIAYSV